MLKNNKIYGFTLIEVIIALTIISIIIMGFTRVLSTALECRKMTEEKNTIVNWSGTIMEFMKTCNLEILEGQYTADDFPRLSRLETEYSNLNKVITGVKISVNKYTDENINENLYKITVYTKWMSGEKEKNYKLSSLVYQEGE